MLFDDAKSNIREHMFFIGTTGAGKSPSTEKARKEARDSGSLLVDTHLFAQNKGLKAYEHEYARRLFYGTEGMLPRSLRGKKATFITGATSRNTNRLKPKHIVTTCSGVHSDGFPVPELLGQLLDSSRIDLDQQKLLNLMEANKINHPERPKGVFAI